MIQLYDGGAYVLNGTEIIADTMESASILAGKLGPWEVTRELLGCIDILVDGEFHQQEKDLTLRFKGSRNQRIIDVNASRQADAVVLWDPENPEEN